MAQLALGKADFNWIGFYVIIVASWVAVLVMSAENFEIKQLQMIYGSDFWSEVCRSPRGISDFFILFLMWAIMSAAMMIPTLQPAMSTYLDLRASKGIQGSIASFWFILIGFMSVWLSYCLAAALFQAIFLEFKLVSVTGSFFNPYLSIVLLLFAGFYQLSTFKAACVNKCRSPLTFFLEFWSEGKQAAFAMGVRLGYTCLGCCWILMSLAFVGGTMNLLFMGLSTILMSLEKFPEIGNFFSRLISILLFFCAGCILVFQLL